MTKLEKKKIKGDAIRRKRREGLENQRVNMGEGEGIKRDGERGGRSYEIHSNGNCIYRIPLFSGAETANCVGIALEGAGATESILSSRSANFAPSARLEITNLVIPFLLLADPSYINFHRIRIMFVRINFANFIPIRRVRFNEWSASSLLSS